MKKKKKLDVKFWMLTVMRDISVFQMALFTTLVDINIC